MIYLWMLNWHVFHISPLGDNLPKAPGTTLLHARFSDRQGSLSWPCFHVERKCRRQSANVMFFSQLFSCCYEEMKLKLMLLLFISRSPHGTTNFTNPKFQFSQFKVLQSVFIFLCKELYWHFLVYFGLSLKLLSCQYLQTNK